MIVLPAIDLLEGRAVRLYQGRYDRVTTYSDDPVLVASQFQDQGATQLHVVDLDAARGQGNNRAFIAQIRHAFVGQIQVGGGVRSLADVRELEECGADRLILGTILVENPELAQHLIQTSRLLFLAGIDAADGVVKIRGWEEGQTIQDVDLAQRVSKLGVRAIIYTNITRDGTLSGPDWERSLCVQSASQLPLILSGGVSSLDDLERAAHTNQIAGVILGKALYDGKINLAEVCRRFVQPMEVSW